MEKSRTLKQLKKIAEEVTGNPIDEEYEPIQEVAIDHICTDSLDRLDLMMRCEKHFKVEIPDNDAYDISSFGELADYICSKHLQKK